VSVCLGDFGLACHMLEQPEELEIMCGTPGYIDPEVLSKQALFSTSSDVFSIGATLFELLTGGVKLFSVPLVYENEEASVLLKAQ
jgi:serine/threonine protein kinase